MKCPSCGKLCADDDRFCARCGVRLHADEPNWRQVTSLFCDLVNSVRLSQRVPAERLREILADYQRVCAKVVQRFDGHIARYFGDGILVHFGWPQAHEDDAYRAVSSGLGIAEGVRWLNSRLETERGISLHVRIAMHTGMVVAGDIAPGEPLESMAIIGDTPNIAARLQGLAAPDTVLITEATHELVQGYFECVALGPRELSGVSEAVATYQVLNESTARTRLDVAALRGLSAMQGRDADLQLLTAPWQRTCEGNGSALLVVGEPGIGKSRLLLALQEHVAKSPSPSLARLICAPYFQGTPYHPLIEFYARDFLKFERNEPAERRLAKIEGYLAQYGFSLAQYVPTVADLLAVPHEAAYPSTDIPADRRRKLTVDWILRTVLGRADRQPLLLLIEDVHWIDPSSLDVLAQLVERATSSRLLLVMSARPEFVPPWTDALAERLTLARLDQTAAAAIVSDVAGAPLPRTLQEHLLGKADGVPLYVEELTKLVVDTGLVRSGPAGFELTRPVANLEIPATLTGSLIARLDQLPQARGLAQVGATIGRQFAVDHLKAVLARGGALDEESVIGNLDQLTDAGLLVRREAPTGTFYTFKHALMQNAAYESLLHSTRAEYHERIARVLAEAPPTAEEIAPELVAQHFTAAARNTAVASHTQQLLSEAVPWWLKAGERAVFRSAYVEAIAHFNNGLDILLTLPDGPARIGQELELRLKLGPALMATRGYGAAEVEDCYRRARALCTALGNPPQLAPVLYGLWTYHVVRAQHRTALELGRQILDLGVATNDDALLVQGNMAVGWAHFFQGHLALARTHLERTLELYEHERHHSNSYIFGDNPATSAGGALACALWLLGYPDQAMHRAAQTLAYLRSLDHPYSVAFGLDVIGIARQYTGDGDAVREVVDSAIALSEERELPLTAAMGTILRGWARTCQSELADGIVEIQQGIAAWLRTGAELGGPYWYCLLAEALGRVGEIDAGLAHLRAAEQAVERTDERFLEPEIYRLRGDLQQQQPDSVRAGRTEAAYLHAIELAKQNDARLHELRAATGLAGLWKTQGKLSEAQTLLASTYSTFNEGLTTHDLARADQLLRELEALRAPA